MKAERTEVKFDVKVTLTNKEAREFTDFLMDKVIWASHPDYEDLLENLHNILEDALDI